ncbi:MAG: hypothetical protein GY853_13880 [PVC group bacterium]|nr:hypothetical protein [PVC group bacterium]
MAEERQHNIPGFQTGGNFIPPGGGRDTFDLNKQQKTPLIGRPDDVNQNKTQLIGRPDDITRPTQPPVVGGPSQRVNQAIRPNLVQPNIQNITGPGQKTQPGITAPNIIDPMTGQTIKKAGQASFGTTTPPGARRAEFQSVQPEARKTEFQSVQPEARKGEFEFTPFVPPGARRGEFESTPFVPPEEQPEQVSPVTPTPDESQFSDSVKFALAELRRLYEGGSPAQRAAYEKRINDLKATQATGRRVAAQQAAQAGIGGVEAYTRELVAARDAGSQLAEATAQMGIADMQVRENALQTMAQIGLQGQQIEQAADQWQQQFDFAKQKYGDVEGQRIFADINAGMTFDQIQAKYPNVTQEDYESMQNATPNSQWERAFGLSKEQWEKQFGLSKEQWEKQFGFGKEQFEKTLELQRDKFGLSKEQWEEAKKNYDFDKKLSAINTLMAQGGKENIKEASKLFKDMFGQDIDFSNAINEGNVQNFNDGMAQMSSYLASGMDWKTAKKAMEQDGTFEKLGMLKSDIKKMYQGMELQSNPIYQADKMYQDLVDNGFMTEKEKEGAMDVIMFMTNNPEGLDVGDKYVVKDENGKVQGVFETEDEANALTKKNKKWGTEFMEGYIQLADPGTGTTGDTGTTGGGQVDENQQYAAFEGELPDPDLIGVVTQAAWVAAGKPKTWKEFQSANILGNIDSLLDKDGNVITKESIDKVFDAIQMQNTQAINNFKMDSKFESTIEDIEVNNERIEGDEAKKIRKKLQKNVGKIFHFPGNEYNPEGDYVIKDVVKRVVKKQGGGTYTYTIVEAMNVDTRKIEKIGLPVEY